MGSLCAGKVIIKIFKDKLFAEIRNEHEGLLTNHCQMQTRMSLLIALTIIGQFYNVLVCVGSNLELDKELLVLAEEFLGLLLVGADLEQVGLRLSQLQLH